MVQSKLLLKFSEITHFFFDKKDCLNLANLPIDIDTCIKVEQIHSNKLAIINDNSKNYYPIVDGLVTAKKLFLAIKTADCLPILFYEQKQKIFAAVHAGWKGLYAGIIENTIKTIVNLAGRKADIVCAIGPHIKNCCYDVSFERISQFQKLGYNVSYISTKRKNSWHLDLGKIAAVQLRRSGISEKNIDIINSCTSCNEKFCSFRRDKHLSGRMWSVIGR